MTPRRPITPRGFTVAELVVALALSTLIALAALSLLGIVTGADKAATERFNETAALQRAYRIIRSITRGATALKPSDAPVAGPEPSAAEVSEVEKSLRADAEKKGLPIDDTTVHSQAIEQARALAATKAMNADEREKLRPRMEVRLEARGSGGAQPVLEVALSEPPVPPTYGTDQVELWDQRTAPLIRGVVEGLPDEKHPTLWALQWRPIDPPGTPVVIVDSLLGWEWKVLPRPRFDKSRDGWQDVAAAWYDADYPTALRLRLATAGGELLDWLFDFPRPVPEVEEEALAEETPDSGLDLNGAGERRPTNAGQDGAQSAPTGSRGSAPASKTPAGTKPPGSTGSTKESIR